MVLKSVLKACCALVFCTILVGCQGSTTTADGSSSQTSAEGSWLSRVRGWGAALRGVGVKQSEDISPTSSAGAGLYLNAQRVYDIQLSSEASRDYFGQYQSDAQQKAFAVSPDGPYGVAYGFLHSSEAQKSALQRCNEAVRKGQMLCVVYDLNGIRQLNFPITVNRR